MSGPAGIKIIYLIGICLVDSGVFLPEIIDVLKQEKKVKKLKKTVAPDKGPDKDALVVGVGYA